MLCFVTHFLFSYNIIARAQVELKPYDSAHFVRIRTSVSVYLIDNTRAEQAVLNKMKFELFLYVTLCLLNLYADGKWAARETANEIPARRPYIYGSDPPPHTELVAMARYTLHNSDWASIATVSVLPAIEGFPFSNVKSIADGNIANSTGIPYFYMSPLDFTAKDLSKNNRATVLVSLEESRYCESQQWDPEDPRCTRLMLTGIMKKVKEGTPEYTFAKGGLFERHPAMADFPADHDWFVAKLKIAQIAMVDYFGGAKYIPVKEYLAYNYTQIANKPRNQFFKVQS